MSEEDYTLQLALLREAIGLPLEDRGEWKETRWWSTNELVPQASRWVTVGTGPLGFYRNTRVVTADPLAAPEQTPDPSYWTILSGWKRKGPESETIKTLWPPVPLSDLLSKLADPNFRMEYMLPKKS